MATTNARTAMNEVSVKQVRAWGWMTRFATARYNDSAGKKHTYTDALYLLRRHALDGLDSRGHDYYVTWNIGNAFYRLQDPENLRR
jgi:hypothetical protein